ncbi:MAG: M48 family metallopeptidase [Bacteroidota bacterium]|nr:M48 family metallopeptidase [Bacteroidota bacterium]
MRKFVLPILIAAFGLTACNLVESKDSPKAPSKVSYSYACLDSAVGGGRTNQAIRKTTGFIRDLAVSKKEITDSVQSNYGEAFHKDAVESKTFVLLNDPAINAQLQTVLTQLLSVREAPSNIRYSIHLIDDKQINAFTFGGYIYLTKAMYDKIRGNNDLLYSIIGHEIGHSEKGHIKQTIQELELSGKLFGDNCMTYFQIKKLLTGSFNQRNELEADYYGIDLTNQLDKNLCATVAFWKEMARSENDYSRLEDFFRTHPFSGLRAQCLQEHIAQNFGRSCSTK